MIQRIKKKPNVEKRLEVIEQRLEQLETKQKANIAKNSPGG